MIWTLLMGLVSLIVISLFLVFATIDTIRYFYMGEIPEYVNKTVLLWNVIKKYSSFVFANIFSWYLLNQEKMILYSTETSIAIFSLLIVFSG